jgi:hypothetical protein
MHKVLNKNDIIVTPFVVSDEVITTSRGKDTDDLILLDTDTVFEGHFKTENSQEDIQFFLQNSNNFFIPEKDRLTVASQNHPSIAVEYVDYESGKILSY